MGLVSFAPLGEEEELFEGESFLFFTLYLHQVPIVDMPVDPNEPTYCLCQQVSYGEMIG